MEAIAQRQSVSQGHGSEAACGDACALIDDLASNNVAFIPLPGERDEEYQFGAEFERKASGGSLLIFPSSHLSANE